MNGRVNNGDANASTTAVGSYAAPHQQLLCYIESLRAIKEQCEVARLPFFLNSWVLDPQPTINAHRSKTQKEAVAIWKNGFKI